MPLSISYILGAYNEEGLIRQSVLECMDALIADFSDFELILVNDGSTDRTGEIMDILASEYKNIKVLHNLVNLNFGISILRGMSVATKDIVMYNAVDLPLTPSDTARIVGEMGTADILVLDRASYPSKSLWRKVTSNTNILLLKLFFPKLMKGFSVMNFIQIFRRDCLPEIMPLARSPIFVWPELIFRARLLGKNVQKIKVSLDPRCARKGAFGKPYDIVWGLTDFFRFRIRLWFRKI